MTTNGRRIAAVGAIAALSVGVLSACGGAGNSGGSSSSANKGTLYYLTATSAKPEHLDPQRVYIGRDITNLSRLAYRQLVTFPDTSDVTAGTKPVPDLATDTGTSSNGAKTWKFTLKDGVKWQDGKPITCDDLKYGASRVFAQSVIPGGPNYLVSYLDVPTNKDGTSIYAGPYDKTAANKAGQAAFDKAITCSGNTITYNFKKPWPDFPLAIAALHMMDPYRQDKDQGDKSNYQVFSDGPYELQGTWNENTGGTFVRNPNYDKSTDSTDIRKALPNKIVFQVGSTTETISDRLIADSGNDQNAVTDRSVPPTRYSQLKGSVNDRLATVESPYIDYLAVNVKHITNPMVRQALYEATNQQGWIDAGGGSRSYKPAHSLVAPSVVGYKANPAFDAPESGDVNKAKQLLQQAGVKTPYPINFMYEKTDTADKQAAVLKSQWEQAGFKVTLTGIDADNYYTTIEKPSNNGDLYWAGWGADWPSAITVTPPLFDGRVNLTKDSTNSDYGQYNDPAFNKLVDQAQNAASLDAQTTALQAADAQLGKDYAYIPLENQIFNLLRGSNVTGYTNTPASNGYPDLGGINVK
ncbi:ABC transporter substrate-binding protein [Nocardioides sp. BP30]|uniref:ABC transporter substrate-binding protein n=1 Tax=Nocardioides sp. BP30 TaxID=3036374 RepID=UPI0024684CF0|nr:ABC transporter substrate-binding protein [Nocardioides sp. BP30]WGL50425.1 ABC transporter substrate-binding protein [Nocardioides sp. BP30]